MNRDTVCIPGIGYCFPDRKCKSKPENGAYIRVKDVTVVEKGGKKFGFYTWEPAEYTEPTEEELIAAYLRDPRPEFLNSTIERMELPKGIAIVLRWFERSGFFRPNGVYHGISLNGWSPSDVSFSVRAQSECPYPVEPMFKDKRTMLDLLLTHGYGKVSEDEIFSALRQANRDNLILPASLDDPGHGYIEKTDTLTVIHGGNYYCRIPVLRGLKPQRDVVIAEKYTAGAKRTALINFIWDYVVKNYRIPKEEMGIPYTGFDVLPQEDLKDDRERLPLTILKYMDKGLLGVTVMYPDFWVVQTDRFLQICLEAEEAELKEILDFCHDEWERMRPEFRKRYHAATNLNSLAFTSIRGESESTKKHSEILEQLYMCRGCEIKRWGNFEYVPSVDVEKMMLDFTEEEITALVGEINRLNAEAEKHVRTAIAKHRLTASDVNMRK